MGSGHFLGIIAESVEIDGEGNTGAAELLLFVLAGSYATLGLGLARGGYGIDWWVIDGGGVSHDM